MKDMKFYFTVIVRRWSVRPADQHPVLIRQRHKPPAATIQLPANITCVHDTSFENASPVGMSLPP
jgi:hypothetical protein